MNRSAAIVILVLVSTLWITGVSLAQDTKTAESTSQPIDSQSKEAPSGVNAPTYRPPLPNAPISRLGGQKRGIPGDSLALAVLTPEKSGLTIQEQPSLYWFLSQLTTYPIELTLTQDDSVEPILETRLSPPTQPGVQRIHLANYSVRLKPDVEYRWFVTAVPDAGSRSKDVLAGGLIQRIEPSANLRARLSQAGVAQAAFIYAEEGIWYDAISAISDMIDAAPNDSLLRRQRASLLKQVRLQEVAEFEGSAVPSSYDVLNSKAFIVSLVLLRAWPVDRERRFD